MNGAPLPAPPTTYYLPLTTYHQLAARPRLVAAQLSKPTRTHDTSVPGASLRHTADPTEAENDDAKGDNRGEQEEDGGSHGGRQYS